MGSSRGGSSYHIISRGSRAHLIHFPLCLCLSPFSIVLFMKAIRYAQVRSDASVKLID